MHFDLGIIGRGGGGSFWIYKGFNRLKIITSEATGRGELVLINVSAIFVLKQSSSFRSRMALRAIL